MTSHFLILTVFAAMVSLSFSLLMRDGERDGVRSQVKFGLVVFFCFIASAFVLGWFMYPFPS